MKRNANGKTHGEKKSALLSEFVNGTDENNLAEFPLALLTDRIPDGLKTLEFTDTLKDWKTGLEVTRRVCITGSHKYGLPTVKDDQVLAALIQLTGITNGFKNAEVFFTKHQVIELLHWDDSGWAYERVEEALHRWKDVSVHYWNAWRDHEQGTWTDTEAIGIIDYFKISDGRRSHGNERNKRSRFVWNRELFKSFQAGYMKPLDFGFYRSLKRPAAQRAYRFLDKRFHHKPEWEFDLRTFACEKLGFSRNYDTGQLKARLKPAMSELERAGYIKPLAFRKVKPRTWSILVAKSVSERTAPQRKDASSEQELETALLSQGVSKTVAETLVKGFSVDRIAEKLRYLAWLIHRRDKRTPINTAGFLVAAIRNDYPVPKEYKKEIQTRAPSQGSAPLARLDLPPVKPAADSQKEQLSVLLSQFSISELESLEENALAGARRVERESYLRQKDVGGTLFQELKTELLLRYLRSKGKLPA